MAGRYTSTAVVMLTVLSGWTRGLADEVVTIGGVAVSAECALARKEHPRLLFTKADLPRLRERLKHPRIAAELRHARQLAAENKAGAILLGVLYYLTDERKYIEAGQGQARTLVGPNVSAGRRPGDGRHDARGAAGGSGSDRRDHPEGTLATARGAGSGGLGPRPR